MKIHFSSKNRLVRRLVLPALAALACSGIDDSESTLSTFELGISVDRVLGFEVVSSNPAQSDWVFGPGSSGSLSSSTTHTEGLKSLQISNLGWAQVQSTRIGPLGQVGANATFDLRVSGSGSIPWGDVILQLDAPSQGLLNAQAGQKVLGGLAKGTWHSISLPLSQTHRTKLSAPNLTDLSVRFSINLPSGSTVLLDRASFGQPPGASGGTGGTGGSGGSSGASGAAGSSGAGGAAGASGSAGAASGSAGTSGSGGSSGTPGNDFEFFFQLPIGVPREAVALDAYGGSLTLEDHSKILTTTAGGFSSASAVASTTTTSIGAHADLQSLWSQANVLLKSSAHLRGNLTTQGTLTKLAGAIVDGATAENTTLDPLERPAWIVSFPSGTLPTQTITNTRTFAPGSFGATTIKPFGKLILSAGTYTFKSLSLEGGGTLEVDNRNGPVFIYVETTLGWVGTVTFKDTAKDNVLFGVAGTASVNLVSSFRGVLVAPRAHVTLGSCTPAHWGSFFAKSLKLAHDAVVRHRPFTPPNFCSAENTTCDGLCPCDGGEGECNDDEDCEPGLICLLGGGPHFGKARGTGACVDPGCGVNPIGLGCGFVGAPCGRCDRGIECDSDTDCPAGEVCGIGKGLDFGLIFDNVCMPAGCRTDEVATGCGTVASNCGECSCTPQCEDKECGDDPADGCGGRCREFCGHREIGCKEDGDCPLGDACVIGAGPRIGQPAGTNACLLEKCLDPNPKRIPCGSVSAECGLCPVPEDDVCANRECGEDPSYGVVCGGGTCGDGLACVQGKCTPDFRPTDLRLQIARRPGMSGDPLPIDPIPVPNLGTVPVPGAVPGSFSVSARGKAVYSVPLAVPPGRAGMEPAISLTYNSAEGNGLVGVGWSISGTSVISRCPRIAAVSSADDGGARFAKPVAYNDTDQLCLDGNPLVHINPSEQPNLTVGAEYRTEIDTFDRIRIIPGSNGRIGFEVRSRDGRILRYGGSDNSLLFRISHVIRAWGLSQIEDRIGNYIRFEYGKFDTPRLRPGDEQLSEAEMVQTAEFWPSEIAYGGVENALGNVDPTRKVLFKYRDDRLDYMEGYTRGGARVVRTKLLDRVDTQLGSIPVRSYRLTYEYAPSGSPVPADLVGPSRLQSVEECSLKHNFTQCKPPTTFEYTDQRGLKGAGGVASVQLSSVRPLGTNGVSPSPLIVLDFNGDGRDDILAHSGGSGSSSIPDEWHLLVATGDTAAGSEPYLDVPTDIPAQVAGAAPAAHTNVACISQASVFDFDGDGRDDFFDSCRGTNGANLGQSGTIRVWRSTGDNGTPFEAVDMVDPDFEPDEEMLTRDYLADLNGDGYKDLFRCAGRGFPVRGYVNDEILFHLGERNGFDPVPRGHRFIPGICAIRHDSTGNSWAEVDPILVGDVDGDGIDDVLMYWSDLFEWLRFVPGPTVAGVDTSDWVRVDGMPGDISDEVRRGLTRFVDINGDGLTDLFVFKDNKDPLVFLNFGGRFAAARSAFASPQAASLARVTTYSVQSSLAIDYNGDGFGDLIRMFENRAATEPPASLWQLDRGMMAGASTQSAGLPWFQPDDLARLGDPNFFAFQPQPGVLPAEVLLHEGANGTILGKFPVTQLADADGDGSQDLLQIASDGRLAISHGNFGRENLLARVTDGMGKRVDIAYDATVTLGIDSSQHRTYLPSTVVVSELDGPGSIPLHRVGPLVSGYEISSERTGDSNLLDRSFVLRYEGAFTGFEGRGWLGFNVRHVEERGPAAHLVIESARRAYDVGSWDETFRLYPFAGLETSSITTSDVEQSDIEPEAAFRRATRANQWKLNTSESGRPFVTLEFSSRQVGERLGVPSLTAEITTYENVDGFGNIGDTTNSVYGADGQLKAVTTTHTEFQNLRTPWLIGQVMHREVTDEVLTEAHTPSATRTVDFTYDQDGLVETITREAGASDEDSQRQVTTIERYNDVYRNIRKTTVVGTWDDEGTTESQARATTLEYEPNGVHVTRLFKHLGTTECAGPSAECHAIDVKYDPRDGTLIARADGNGIGERWSYDAFGRELKHETAADVLTTTYESASSDASQPITVHRRLKIHTTSQNTEASSTKYLDSLGRPVQSVATGIGGDLVFQEVEYFFGNLVQQTSRPHTAADTSQGIVADYYDRRFRLIQRVFPETSVRFLHASFGNSTVPLEENEVWVRGQVNPRLYESFTFEDARGNPLRTVDELGNSTRFEREAFGLLGRITDSVGQETTILSDRLGRTTSHTDGDTGTTSFTYTAFDEVLTREDMEDRVTKHQYDELGRLSVVTMSDGGSSDSTLFFYDGSASENRMGRLVGTTSGDGHTEEYTYEPHASDLDPLKNRGFLTQIDRTIANDLFTTKLNYNAKSQLSSVEYPPSAPTGEEPTDEQRFSVHYGYDAFGNLRCAAQRATPNESCPDRKLWALDQADQAYRIRSESFGNGVGTTYTYEALTGRMESMVTKRGDAVLRDIQYVNYDDNGNLETRIETLQLPGTGGGVLTVADGFGYDELDRLTNTATVRALNGGTPEITGGEIIAYDPTGNITSRTSVGTYDYEPQGTERRLPHGVRRITGSAGTTQLDYDAAGNVIVRGRPSSEGGTQTISYTNFNLPREVSASAAPTVRYEYDANQRRVLLTVGNGDANLTLGEEQRIYVGSGYERQEAVDAGGDVTRHLYKVMAAGRQIAQVEREVRMGIAIESRRFMHADHLGSSHLTTNEEGEVAHIQRFDPFGAPEAPASQSTDDPTKNIRAGFTGHETDIETGLVNMRGRIYDPKIGRFMQADPILQVSSQGLNRFSYVKNNPLNSADPSGFCGDDCGGEDPPEEDPENDSSAIWSLNLSSGEMEFVGYADASTAVAISGTSHISGGEGGIPIPAADPAFQHSAEMLLAQNKPKDEGVRPTSKSDAAPAPAPASGAAPKTPSPPKAGPAKDPQTKSEQHAAPSGTQPPIQHEAAHGSEASQGEAAGAGSEAYHQTFEYQISHGDYWGSSILQSNETLTNAQNFALMVSFSAALAATGGLALGESAFGLTLSGVGKAAAAKGVGGAVSTGFGSAMSGQDPAALIQSMLVGAGVSAANLFAPAGSSGLSGGYNSALTNFLNQSLAAANGGPAVDPNLVVISLFTGATLGFGAGPVDSLGGNVWKGVAGGPLSGQLKVTITP